MSRKPILVVIALIALAIIVFSLLILLRLGSSVRVEGAVSNGVGVRVVSVIGRYQSDSAYSMVEVYGNGVSVFVSPLLWNMAYSRGLVNMTLGNYLHVSVDLRDFRKVNPSIPVDGYPSVMYGQECWPPFAGRTVESGIALPARIANMPNFNSTVYYTIYQVDGVVDDFSYDIWLTENPCPTNLVFPDIEIMVWLYHEGHLPSPPFIEVGNLTVTVYVNGKPIKDAFIVYVLPHTGSASGWIGVYYVSGIQLVGRVTIPLSELIRDSFNFINRVYPSITPSSYYLDAIQLGMEFNDDNGTAILGYTLYYWELNNTTLIGQSH
mgnify:CR=1 FL=1